MENILTTNYTNNPNCSQNQKLFCEMQMVNNLVQHSRTFVAFVVKLFLDSRITLSFRWFRALFFYIQYVQLQN